MIKYSLAADRIAEGIQDNLELGYMDSLHDWSYAKDHVECKWLIMQQEKPEDFVIATGVQHNIRDFKEKAFAVNGMTFVGKVLALMKRAIMQKTENSWYLLTLSGFALLM